MKQIALFLLLGLPLSAAKLEFDEPLKEAHAELESKTVTADFTFRNGTEETVTIAKYEAGCSCMAAQVAGGKLRYGPGETGTLRATFEVGNFQGTVDKSIALWLDADPEDEPSVQVVLRVHIPVIILVEPKTLQWELKGPGDAQSLDVRMDHDKPIHVTAVSSSSEAVTTELRTVEKGKHYQVVVKPTRVDVPALTIIRIETDSDVEKFRVQQAFAVIRAPLPKPTAKP